MLSKTREILHQSDKVENFQFEKVVKINIFFPKDIDLQGYILLWPIFSILKIIKTSKKKIMGSCEEVNHSGKRILLLNPEHNL